MGFLEDGEPEMSPRTIERKKQELLDRKRAREEAAEQEEVERLIPVQWVTSDRDLEQWAPPPGLDEIICESARRTWRPSSARPTTRCSAAGAADCSTRASTGPCTRSSRASRFAWCRRGTNRGPTWWCGRL